MARLEINQPAPTIALKDANGDTVELAQLWGKSKVLLTFVRHFG